MGSSSEETSEEAMECGFSWREETNIGAPMDFESRRYRRFDCGRGNAGQRDKLFDITCSEFSPMDNALSRDLMTCISKVHHKGEVNAYCVKATGAMVTLDSSIALIHKYCEMLPKDRYFMPKPFFQMSAEGGCYRCILILPPNAALQRIVGPPSINSKLAKQLVSLEACKKLHELEALSDYLLPFLEEPPNAALTEASMEYASGAGTTKRKELHGMISVRALSGTWAHRPDDITLNAYKLNFICDQPGETYAEFVLLVEALLDDDVAGAEMELFLIPNKLVKTSVSPCGQIHLDAEQVKKSKLFQEFFFNGIFGKLFTGSRSSGVKRDFLLGAVKDLPWSSLNMYFILPLDSTCLTGDDSIRINWKGIDACATVVEFVKDKHSLDDQHCSDVSLGHSSCSHEAGYENSDLIYLANKSLQVDHLRDSVVLAIHTGRIYSVLDVLNEINAASPFDEIFHAKPSNYVSFMDYYHQKYGIVLQHPTQPLFLLKQSHNPHNLLFAKTNYPDGVSNQNVMCEKAQVHAHIPPELLVHIDVSTNILKSFYLLPSVMHRLEALMSASQLREEIDGNSRNRISSSLILEALATQRCCENFSLERLELLGDSVLKYAVSCHLFLEYPKKHEGQLSNCRSGIICNSTLHRLGIGCSLQCYIRDGAFDPRRWTAPGQISLHPFPCFCGVDTYDVPLTNNYVTEDTSVVVGKMCDKGHRWMCSKTIADCAEALIGAYYAGGGLEAALSLIRWLGIEVRYDELFVKEAKITSSHWGYLPKVNEIKVLEWKLDYKFAVKGLLLEAVTHPSRQGMGINYCYQRLEFLGDSVLDLLITWHLFQNHTEIDPGELTDLRSASVNNENFAQAVVRHNLHPHLQHGSKVLSEQIAEYVNCLSKFHGYNDLLLSLGAPKGPKVLGDLVESIAGALLIDTDLNLDKLKDDLLVGHGCSSNRKAAKAQAALCLLKELKKRGIFYAQCMAKWTQCKHSSTDGSCNSSLDSEILSCKIGDGVFEPKSPKKQSKLEILMQQGPPWVPSIREETYCQHDLSIEVPTTTEGPVILQVNLQKGCPRRALYELCRTLQWPIPKFQSTEEKFRNPIILDGVLTPHFNLFTSSIKLHIPNMAVIELMGEPKVDKKSSQDSAALVMLHELQKQHRCVIR